VQTYDGQLILGQVKLRNEEQAEVTDVTSVNGEAAVQDSIEIVTSTGYTRTIRTNFIRFHASPNTADVNLKRMEFEARELVKEGLPRMRKVLEALGTGNGTEALLYEPDFVHRVFGANSEIEAKLAGHLFLFDQEAGVAKDWGFGRTAQVYRLRGRAEMGLIKWAGELSETDALAFGDKLFKAVHGKAPFEVASDLDRRCIEGLLAYALASHVNTLGNPLEAFARRVLTGISAIVPSEALRILGLVGQLPFDLDPVTRTAGPVVNQLAKTSSHDNTAWFISPPNDKGRRCFDGEAIAIDSARTEEVDDAISTGEDGWLHVHIADVSSSVPLGSPLMTVAGQRVSSVYLPTHRLPMLPHAVTEADSLDPLKAVNRALTFSAKIGSDGAILDYRVQRSLLTGLTRSTYEAADAQADKWGGLQRITQSHYASRLRSGHVPFHIPKPEIHVHPGDKSIEFALASKSHPSDSSRFMVSEAMLIAGRVAAMHAIERHIPIPFRGHPAPTLVDTGLLSRLQAVKEDTGMQHRFDCLRLLSSLAPSTLDTKPNAHWAMGLDAYAKATSPLRRYFDLLLHAQFTASKCPLNDRQLAALLPAAYRHEQYLKSLQRASLRFWTLRYAQQRLQAGDALPGPILILDASSASASTRQKVWIESLGLICYASLLGKLPYNLEPGQTFHTQIVAVDPFKSTIDLQIIE
jgi:hypothetical protein